MKGILLLVVFCLKVDPCIYIYIYIYEYIYEYVKKEEEEFAWVTVLL